MRPLRLILVGLGARGRTWLRIIDECADAELVGLCDPDAKARARAAQRRDALPVAADLAALGDVGADAVLLATPPAGRAGQIEACCRLGVAVLAEKPLADDIADAARFVAMAEAAGILLVVGLNFRFLAVTVEMRRLLHSGAIGTIGFGRFTYERWRDGTQARLNSYPLKMQHPMLWEQSIHHFDLMRYVYGREPLHVQAHTFNPAWTMYAGDTNVSAMIAFEGNLSVNYQGTWQAGHEPMHFSWRTDGSEGIVEQRSMFGDLAFAKRRAPELTPVPLPHHEPWITDAAALLSAFIAMCRGDAPADCTGRDHLQSLFMLQACIWAAERRAAVEIEEVNQRSKSAL
ncbi:MAG: Gfo/Idh/MocA family oxidoreductase [Pseudomonadota bacterium]